MKLTVGNYWYHILSKMKFSIFDLIGIKGYCSDTLNATSEYNKLLTGGAD
jgi:hypothetical protein